jgi:hypothetical protein
MIPEKPIGIAMIICDQILEDKSSGKRSLIGLFSTVQCGSFPATLQKLCVFVTVTQLCGNVSLILKCSNETCEDPIVAVPGNINSSDPNAILELGFEFDKFSFPRPGIYTFELLWEQELILQTRFNVFLLTNK